MLRGGEAEPDYYLELEYPVRGEDADDPADRVSGHLCARCASRVARSPGVGRLIKATDALDPSAGREAHTRAADGLFMVTQAMEAVDLNALLDDDVRALLDAKGTIEDMCLRNRETGRASCRERVLRLV